MNKDKRLLIFGARKKSIGAAVGKMWSDMFDGDVVTAGITNDEDHLISMDDADELKDLIRKVEPDRIFVTIGRNDTIEEAGDNLEFWLSDHFHTNVTMPMMVLDAWLEVGGYEGGHFVAMSSNSAAIPRSKSMAYCASKAALSMAIRCAARDVGKAGLDLAVYGWEPGLVKGTPMTAERSGTRMLGLPEGMGRRALANQIVNAMAFGGAEYSGVLVRLDNGEV